MIVFFTLALQGCSSNQDELTVGALKHFRRGNLLFSENKPSGAIAEYKMAIALDNQQAVFYFNMGLAYYRLVLYNQAIEAYHAAIDRDPEFGEAWYNLSLALDKTGETDRAFLAYEKYLAINQATEKPARDSKQSNQNRLQKPKIPAGTNN